MIQGLGDTAATHFPRRQSLPASQDRGLFKRTHSPPQAPRGRLLPDMHRAFICISLEVNHTNLGCPRDPRSASGIQESSHMILVKKNVSFVLKYAEQLGRDVHQSHPK